MNLETIEKLIQFMEQHGLTELQVHEGDLEFKARRGERPQAPFIFQPAHGLVTAAPLPAENGGAAPANGQAAAAAGGAGPRPGRKEMKEICSPMVGTFYRRPSPSAPPYKEVGDHVHKDDVVCIVEAMKVMNEIKAEVNGVIRKIFVEDSSSIEYGQPLFLVELD